MRKIFLDVLIVAGIVLAYVLMAAYQPMVNEIIASANATGEWANFQDAQAVVNSYPIYSWFLPGFCGLIAIVVNHVSGE